MTQNASNRLHASTLIVVGLASAALAALLIYRGMATGPLFAQSVPSVVSSAPQTSASAVERARVSVRAAMQEQNLPGVSVAVGSGDAIVWAEGFGWRDVDTRAPVTPATRFNIGTAAPGVLAAVAQAKLTDTGSEDAGEWSPGHIGEPEEDFPGFTFIRHLVFIPLGLAAQDQPLPGDRATFYVPRFGDDPRAGRRLMYMRHLACCANGLASYSTPSDLGRYGLAMKPASIDGALAGGMVMSLLISADRGTVVAVTSNISHANTAVLAQHIADAFAAQTP